MIIRIAVLLAAAAVGMLMIGLIAKRRSFACAGLALLVCLTLMFGRRS